MKNKRNNKNTLRYIVEPEIFVKTKTCFI